jgi:hypothetical protein
VVKLEVDKALTEAIFFIEEIQELHNFFPSLLLVSAAEE